MAIQTIAMMLCLWQMSLLLHYRSLHVTPITTKMSVASAYIATTVNVAPTSYCHAWQRTTMVARNPNSCNAKLTTVAIPYCNVTFCNHCQRTRFSCNIYLLQPNWAYATFFHLAQGLEVSSVRVVPNNSWRCLVYMLD